MRTYSRAEWEAAQASWGGFSPEWREIRHAMALNGCIFAPSGTELDSWEDDAPSQRAVLIRAIRETPALLGRCAAGATSWSQVIGRLMRERDGMREASREADAEDASRRREEREADRRSMRRLADVMATLADSGTPIRGEP